MNNVATDHKCIQSSEKQTATEVRGEKLELEGQDLARNQPRIRAVVSVLKYNKKGGLS